MSAGRNATYYSGESIKYAALSFFQRVEGHIIFDVKKNNSKGCLAIEFFQHSGFFSRLRI